MSFTGVIRKMKTQLNNPVQYFLDSHDWLINFNQAIGKNVSITFKEYQCLQCGLNKPIFRQGFDKGCFFDSAQAGDWIMRPELSKAHLGIEDRDLAYEKKVQLQPHVVYLANSSHVKVGITRQNQIPTRWIDQGAHQALVIAEVPNRYLSGVIEVALKNYISDKTSWQKMLKNHKEDARLVEIKNQLSNKIPAEALKYISTVNETVDIDYPVSQYPQKPKSLKLDKTPIYTGILKGIKGQYLLFENDTVFNVRAHEGYVVEWSFTEV